MEFMVRLADVDIRVVSLFAEVHELCRDYLTDGEPEFTVTTAPDDIIYEKEVNIREAMVEGIPVVEYPDSYLETLAVYRKIVAGLMDKGIMLMHGAVIAVGDKAWLFTAPSGTGKTTHINLWLENIPGSYVVNGDKPLIRVGESPIVYGTPWAGKEGLNKNIGVNLCGIVLLDRGAENEIEKVSFSQIMPVLIQQSYRPKTREGVQKSMNLLCELCKNVPLYHLQCNMLPEAAWTVYNTVSEPGSGK